MHSDSLQSLHCDNHSDIAGEERVFLQTVGSYSVEGRVRSSKEGREESAIIGRALVDHPISRTSSGILRKSTYRSDGISKLSPSSTFSRTLSSPDATIPDLQKKSRPMANLSIHSESNLEDRGSASDPHFMDGDFTTSRVVRAMSMPHRAQSSSAESEDPRRSSERKNVLHEGALDKRGKHNTAWKGRFFVLCRAGAFNQETRLMYFSSDADRHHLDRARGSIPIDRQVTVSEGSEDEGRFSIFIVVPRREGFPDRTFILGALSADTRRQWMDALAQARSRTAEGRVQPHAAAAPADGAAAPAAGGERVLMEGTLLKRGQINPAWKSRFCLLIERRAAGGGAEALLRYFEKEGDKFAPGGAKGEVHLSGAAVVAGGAERGRFLMTVAGSRAAPGRTFVLAAASEEARRQWVDALAAAAGSAAA